MQREASAGPRGTLEEDATQWEVANMRTCAGEEEGSKNMADSGELCRAGSWPGIGFYWDVVRRQSSLGLQPREATDGSDVTTRIQREISGVPASQISPDLAITHMYFLSRSTTVFGAAVRTGPDALHPSGHAPSRPHGPQPHLRSLELLGQFSQDRLLAVHRAHRSQGLCARQ